MVVNALPIYPPACSAGSSLVRTCFTHGSILLSAPLLAADAGCGAASGGELLTTSDWSYRNTG